MYLEARKTSGGFVALVTVLLVGAIGISVAIAVITMGISVSRSSFAREQSARARALADACGETALMQIRTSPSYTGSSTLTLGQGSCEYAVFDTGGQSRLINATGTVTQVIPPIIRKVRIGISSISPIIVITSWNEVAD
jgi:shikimate 5-dehydrogenase